MSLKCPACGLSLSLNLAPSGVEVEAQIGPSKLEIVPQPRVGGVRSRTRFNYENPDFQAFWKAYPRKIGKASAFSTFLKIIVEVEPQKLIAAASQFAIEVEAQNIEMRFVPYPQTWLNAGRWDDEKPTERARSDRLVYGSPEWKAANPS